MLADVLQEGAKQGGRVEKHQVGCQACGDLVVTEKEKVYCLGNLSKDTTHLPVLEVPLLLFPHRIIELAFVKVNNLDTSTSYNLPSQFMENSLSSKAQGQGGDQGAQQG